MEAKTRYARNGNVHLAYRVFGDAPRDIVLVPGTVSHVELYWELPANQHLLQRLASFARVIVFDKRGQGLSDRDAEQTIGERVGDLLAVMNAAESKRATVYGWSEGGQMSLQFAATRPARVAGLVLYGSYASIQKPPWNVSREEHQRFLTVLERHWGEGILVRLNAPRRVDDKPFVDWFGRLERAVASPSAILALMRANYEIDVGDVLPSIRVPTLILHRAGDALVPVEAGRHMGRAIPGARYVELPGDDHMLQAMDQEVLDRLIDTIEEFVLGPRPRWNAESWRDPIRRHGMMRQEEQMLHRRNGGGAGVLAVAGCHGEPATESAAGATFRREGEFWTASWRGNVVRLKDAKGLRYIAYLLANPRRQVLANDLAAIGAGPAARRTSLGVNREACGLGDAGAWLDARARAQYLGRIADLRHELAEALEFNDPCRTARLRAELECLGDQLSAALGLGGRDRKAAAHRERARLMVTKAIKAAIARVRASDAALGRHFANSIKTGNLCAYDPGELPAVRWDL